MRELEASRRLVKSPPELWAQCSDAATLTRHLQPLGEITITRLEPESTVAWEGDRVSGTVRLEVSGWGTRVSLTAAPAASPATGSAPAETRRDPAPAAEAPARGGGLVGRLAGWLLHRAAPAPTPAAPTAPDPRPVDPSTVAAEVLAALEAALDSLGQAHHRPYSRG